MKRVVDLSHRLNSDTPVYPGTVAPAIAPSNTIEADGFREKSLLMPSHFGTHIDAPAHVLRSGKTLDELPIEHFQGRAAMMDARETSTIDSGAVAAFLEDHPTMEFVIIRTGWERYWRQSQYFRDYPILSEGAAELLAGRGLKGVGVDAISVDAVGDTELPAHHTLLRSDVVIVENLCNLAALPQRSFMFQCLPLKLEDGDGSPVRAVASI